MESAKLEEGNKLKIDFQKQGGLVVAIAQDYTTKEILMIGYANQEALDETLRTRLATFWSRSQNKLWTKGSTSGDILLVDEIRVDCDQDSLIYLVKPLGSGACHTKDESGKARKSCFYRRIGPDGLLYDL